MYVCTYVHMYVGMCVCLSVPSCPVLSRPRPVPSRPVCLSVCLHVCMSVCQYCMCMSDVPSVACLLSKHPTLSAFDLPKQVADASSGAVAADCGHAHVAFRTADGQARGGVATQRHVARLVARRSSPWVPTTVASLGTALLRRLRSRRLPIISDMQGCCSDLQCLCCVRPLSIPTHAVTVRFQSPTLQDAHYTSLSGLRHPSKVRVETAAVTGSPVSALACGYAHTVALTEAGGTLGPL